MGNKKLQVWLPLLFSIVMIAGMFFGYRLNGGGKGTGFFKTSKPTTLQEAVDVIRFHYVDPVSLDSLQTGAIQEMMKKLDPHSVYFPPVELKEANEELAGEFEGIGIEYNIFYDTVNVVYVIPEGPSEKAGLQIGDKIIKADDSSLTAPNISPATIKEHIRGQKGSIAKLTILRNGQLKTVNVTRQSIPQFSVDAAYMINDTTGYIKLNRFTETSYEEVMKALEDLQKKGLKSLIFDLRDNGGGYMDEAVDIADEFLDQDKLIVYTEGTNSKKREYRCKRPGLFETGKLCVLVNELSASASEVLAGALQDWCRATIIGRRTFGKGLVQENWGLSDGSAIRLTVARYYTPIGRSIQRPYDKGKKVYMDEIWERYQNGEALYADSNKIQKGEAYPTNCGDTLYGGGGIMPNVFVPIDTAAYPVGIDRLVANGSFNNFVYLYYLRNRGQIDKYASVSDYIKKFDKDQLWNEFINYIGKAAVHMDSINGQQRERLQTRLEASLSKFRWRNNGLYEVLNKEDNVINKALVQMTK